MVPNLDDPHKRRAFRRDLRSVARLLRWSGLTMLALGLAGLLLGRSGDWWTGPSWFSLVVGAGLVTAGIVQRTRYHRRKMSGLP